MCVCAHVLFLNPELDCDTSERVAIKRLTKVLDDLVDAKRVLREIYILRHLNHENLISLLNVFMPEVLLIKGAIPR